MSEPRTITLTAEQCIAFFACATAIGTLEGLAQQMKAAQHEPLSRMFLRHAAEIAEKRDKYMSRLQSGIVTVGADAIPDISSGSQSA